MLKQELRESSDRGPIDPSPCQACSGTGEAFEGGEWGRADCDLCMGSGRADGRRYRIKTCKVCRGTKVNTGITTWPCSYCYGVGHYQWLCRSPFEKE